MQITISGQTPAKKNARQIFVKNGRIVNIPSKNHAIWEKQALLQLKSEYRGHADKPVTIAYSFYVKDNRRRDLDNMIASINDVLVKAKLIEDDNWQTLSIGGANAYIDKNNPRCELWVEQD